MKRFIIIVVLVVIVVAGFNHWFKVQRRRRLVCGTNLSRIARAILIYTNERDDKFPSITEWCDLLIEHGEVTEEYLRCPGASEGPCNYAMNKNVQILGTHSPPEMVVLFESHPGWNQSGGPEILTTDNHQDKGCNVLFADSHVEFVETEDLDNLKWDPAKSEPKKPSLQSEVLE